ncbi:hydroxyethylthiazole kinase [Natronomonas sp. F2-12]|uniref:Hydroxyethylthiazole kinase n=1 Tax=Natronomonas aquatica TaxID=2841590 RepID=A0A9R1CT05_9EURY|nr:hydroxyethylthiazole kinase [Natronomonas aquatica]MCQ4333252.1 hydroxyethylthiazole kinase [Natronomonas aquatica]
MSEVETDLAGALGAIADTEPLINAVTNNVTVNDVANVTLHWGGLPVMSDDEREVGDMVAAADGCLLNMGTVDEAGEATMLTAGGAASEHGLPLVVDPVGVGATPTRTRVATRLVEELDVTVLKGNHAEITALSGADAEVRGVESVGEYAEIAERAVSCAREYDTVVVASGETDVVADAEGAYELAVGHPMMGQVVGTGCMLGVTLATFAAGIELDRPLEAALSGAVGFGLAGERAATDGSYDGPASYRIAFLDAVAGMADRPPESGNERIERVLSA